METYDDVILTEAEKTEALRKAREEKHYTKQREEYLQHINKPRQFVTYTAEQYYKAFCKDWPIDEKEEKEYSDVVKRLCCYFAGDKRFNIASREWDLSKGILLFGGVGVGKSTLMQIFQVNQSFSYRLISCRQAESEFLIDGPATLDRYSVNYPTAVNSNPFGHTEIGYCFDDLGTENPGTKHFGNVKNVMTDILLNRYDSKMDKRSTHLTTNLNVDEIEATYGTRVLDRMREMFNIIGFSADVKSRR